MSDQAAINKTRLEVLSHAGAGADSQMQQSINMRTVFEKCLGHMSMEAFALALFQENETLRLEAGRYRWLRDGTGEAVILRPGEDLGSSEVLAGEDADVAIDRFMNLAPA